MVVLFMMRCSQKRIVWGRNNFLLIWVFRDLIKYSFKCRAKPFGMNFLLTLVDIILNQSERSFRLSYLTVLCHKVDTLFSKRRYDNSWAETKKKQTFRNLVISPTHFNRHHSNCSWREALSSPYQVNWALRAINIRDKNGGLNRGASLNVSKLERNDMFNDVMV